MTRPITIGIVEDHPVFRTGLTTLFESTDGITVGFAYASVTDMEREPARHAGIDLVVLDLRLERGGPSGADAVRAVRRLGPRVLVVSALFDRSSVVDAMRAGANGYVDKHAEEAEILRAVRTVADDRSYIAPDLAGHLLHSQRELTTREREILELLRDGLSDRDIAATLSISERTVHGHLDRIRNKIGARKRTQLLRVAIEEGLIPPPNKK